MHIGTGWYCWNGTHPNKGDNTAAKLKFNASKDNFLKDAIDIYISIKNDKDKSPIIKYLNKQIRYNRGDVVQRFLEYLNENKDRELDPELCKFFRSRNWENFIDRLFLSV